MTYNGDNIIGKPTLAMIEIYIAEKGLFVEPTFVFEYWENKGWLTKKGTEVKTLENAIDVANGISIHSEISKQRKHKKETKKHDTKKCSKKGQKGDKKPEPYRKQLTDKRWYSFRKTVFEHRGYKCECCGSKENLQVHHTKYKQGRMAWEYSYKDMKVLCRNCHKQVHRIYE